MIRPPVIIPMPADARILGSYLSESRPEMDATMAIITGWVIRINPASLGERPKMY
jgi:hypothetical protein